MASWMTLALLALAVFGTAGAIIAYRSVPLEESVARATVVAHVRIARIEDRTFLFRGKPIYAARITTSTCSRPSRVDCFGSEISL